MLWNIKRYDTFNTKKFILASILTMNYFRVSYSQLSLLPPLESSDNKPDIGKKAGKIKRLIA